MDEKVPIPDNGARRSAQQSGNMGVRAFRWIAVPVAIAAGQYLAEWLFVVMRMSCLHFGARPEGLCSDWWYENESWAAASTCGVVLFVVSVLLPTLLAPNSRRLVGATAFAVAVLLTAVTFDLWVSTWAISVVVVLAAASVCLLYTRRMLNERVA